MPAVARIPDFTRFNVRAFGALGNTIHRQDGSITSGDKTLTSASTTFTSRDVGKRVSIQNAGVGGNLCHNATIASINSAHSVEISSNAVTTVTGEDFAYYTDDSAAIQRCIDAAHAAASSTNPQTVLIPPGCYGLTCALSRKTDLFRPPNNFVWYGVKTYSNVHILGVSGSILYLPYFDIDFPHHCAAVTNHGADDTNFSIKGVTFDGGARGLVSEITHWGAAVTGHASVWQVNDNEFYGWQGKGINILGMYDGTDKCSKFTISRNTIRDGGHGNAIVVDGGSHCRIEDNDMYDLANPGSAESLIFYRLDNFSIRGNRSSSWGNMNINNFLDMTHSKGIVADNYIEQPEDGGGPALNIDLSYMNGVQFVNNIFDASACTGTTGRGVGGSPATWEDVLFAGNVMLGGPNIDNNQENFIAGTNFINCLFTNNLTGGDDFGIFAGTTAQYLQTRNMGSSAPQGYGSGTGTIPSGGGSVVITHGLPYMPRAQDINITITNLTTLPPGHLAIANIGATTFQVYCSSNPGASGLNFAWKIIT